ncbi:hypothetical protein SAMN05421879_10191 [Ornithinimicrobium cerasi]|uniref:Uncharacterized protein n=2 Tax=Ornithinimicrobium cerasi TaxID=2248773 RepID=A0A285VB54_9MICO|nr:hypothetical protein SAMN05421879_10191 [Ornithinimicrobium cerasi]
MMRRQGVLTAVVGLGVSMLLNGCSDNSLEDTTVPAPTTETSVTSEPVATSEPPADEAETTTARPELSAEEQDQADIEETLLAFDEALVDALTGQESIEGIYPYSRDTARDQWVTQVMAYDAQGVTFSGVTDMEILEISIEGGTADVVGCRDVSALEAVNSDGESIITDVRLDQSVQDFLLERDASAELGWYVVSDVSRNEPCDG